MGPVVCLAESGKNPSHDRCYGVAQYLKRVRSVLQQEKQFEDISGNMITLFKSLYEGNDLIIQKQEEYFTAEYLPSAHANLCVYKDGDAHLWPGRIHTRQKKSFRVTNGVIIRCPIEGEAGSLDVFTTDWAPFASVCAVAVHSQHPVVDQPDDRDDYFTGKFVRHPLTGDLIPVHVAHWVKPDFGTGAVLINPGHDGVDLKYARQVGLPIRFSLAPESFDGTPSTWLSPPVKIWLSTKTGFYDGIPRHELDSLYFDKLKEFGMVERYQDHQAGKWTVARLDRSDSGTVSVNSALQVSFTDQGGGAPRFSLEPTAILKALASLQKGQNPVIVTPASEIEHDLLGLRLAYLDAFGEPLVPERIEVVQGVNESELMQSKFFSQAALFGARTNTVSSPKKQLIEQVERFHLKHEKFVRIKPRGTDEIQPTKSWKTAVRTLQSLQSDGLSRAFFSLYNLQKELLRTEVGELAEEPAFQAYLLLVYLIVGTGDLDKDFDSGAMYRKLVGQN